jgi:hypothetical protein
LLKLCIALSSAAKVSIIWSRCDKSVPAVIYNRNCVTFLLIRPFKRHRIQELCRQL